MSSTGALADEVFTLVTQGESGPVLVPEAEDRLRERLLAVPLPHIEDAVEEVLGVAHFLDAQKSAPEAAMRLVHALESFVDHVVKSGLAQDADSTGVERSRRQLKTMLGRPTSLSPTGPTLRPPSTNRIG